MITLLTTIGSAPAVSFAKTICHAGRKKSHMTAESLVGLLEEMMDLKLQQYAQANLKLTPEVAQLLQSKRETDRRRLAQVRCELARILES